MLQVGGVRGVGGVGGVGVGVLGVLGAKADTKQCSAQCGGALVHAMQGTGCAVAQLCCPSLKP